MCLISPQRSGAAERAWPFVELLDSRIREADGKGAEEARINKHGVSSIWSWEN